METKMKAAYLPGNSTVEFREVDIPQPEMGSTHQDEGLHDMWQRHPDLQEHLGKVPEAYQNKIAGHEPCGQIVQCGSHTKRFREAIGWWFITFQDAVCATTAAKDI